MSKRLIINPRPEDVKVAYESYITMIEPYTEILNKLSMRATRQALVPLDGEGEVIFQTFYSGRDLKIKEQTEEILAMMKRQLIRDYPKPFEVA